MTKLTWPNDVDWVETQVIKMHDNPPPESQWLYKLWLPYWLAEWDVFANWERERLASMAAELKQGDVLFDIGTEIGWCNLLYAKFVGPKNMVLIEPSRRLWPNIKALWERNFPEAPPLACHAALFASKTTSPWCLPKHTFPDEAEGQLTSDTSYRSIHEHGHMLPQIMLDDYVGQTGIVPDALTIDVEGAEMDVLEGALGTLQKHSLKAWVSIHPELMEKHYSASPSELHALMAAIGYMGQHLATDHEEHWLFTKGPA